MVSYHRTRRSRSALAYGSRSTAPTENSTGSYTTSGDATNAEVTATTVEQPGFTNRRDRIVIDYISPWPDEQ